MAGRMLDVTRGEHFVARCLGSTPSTSRTFNADYVVKHADIDFNPFSPDAAK